jgi:anti-anti-sigma regulatory factor
MNTGPHTGRADDPRGPSVVAVNDVEAGLVLLTVQGRWDHVLRRHATRWLHKAFAEGPSAVIVDLAGLTDPDAASLPTWVTARHTGAGLEPAVDVAVCAPSGEFADRLDRMGAGRFLPAFLSMAEARTAVLSRRVLTDRMRLRLGPRPGAPAAARRMVSDACAAWGMPELTGGACLVVSELVSNAVEHAGTDMVVLVSRRPDGVHIAVCDQDSRMPQVPEHDSDMHLRGRGLMMTGATAAAWGAMPTATGKVVWATLR